MDEIQTIADENAIINNRIIFIKKMPLDKRHNTKILYNKLQKRFKNYA